MAEVKTPEQVMKEYREAGGPPISYNKGWYTVGEGAFTARFRKSKIEDLTANLKFRKARGDTQ